MTRRYYVQAVDEKTGEPLVMTCLDAGDVETAMHEAHREACMRAGHLRVRVTHITEQGSDAAGAVAALLLQPRRVA
jgi:hypothetical protein